MNSSSIEVPDVLYQPFSGWMVLIRVVVVLWMVILVFLGLFVGKEAAPLLLFGVPGALFIWLGYEAFNQWHKRWRKAAFLTGEECQATVVAKECVHIRGCVDHYRLTVEFVAGGHPVRSSLAVDDRYALRAGEQMKIRYLRDSPSWWVPAGA